MPKLYTFCALVLTYVLNVPVARAAEDTKGLVTCSGGDCNFCSFVDMTNGLIDWTIIIATVLTVLLLAFAGFRLITSAGDASALEHAKKLLLNSFIGILIMLAGWTIVDTGLKMFAGGDLGVWNAVECGKAFDLAPASDFGIGLKTGQGINVENQDEGQPTGDYLVVYSLNSSDSCKQMETVNFSSPEMCQSALSVVTSSGDTYVVRGCGNGVSIGSTPSWSRLPDCAVSSALIDGLSVNASMQPIFDPAQGGSSMVKPGAAQTMQATLSGAFARLQQGFGRQIVINDAIAKTGTSRETNTLGSRHFYGDALDLSTSGMSNADKIRLFEEAKRAGFTGFGFGKTILHVDLGAPRGWAYGNSTYGGQGVQSLIGSI